LFLTSHGTMANVTMPLFGWSHFLISFTLRSRGTVYF